MNHFPSADNRARHRRRGSALIAILIVVVIILAVMMLGPLKTDNTQRQVSQGIVYIDRSADVVCGADRKTIETDVTQMRILNNGQMPTLEELRNRFGNRRCPRGGAFYISPDGHVYCTKHATPPI